MKYARSRNLVLASSIVWSLLFAHSIMAGQLYVGAATVTITPEERVALQGQFATRISSKVESPCLATALVIETRDGEQSLDQAIFVSCDLCGIKGGMSFYELLRGKLKGQLPHEVLPKIVLNATHTHTAPVIQEGQYTIPESGVMQPLEYRDFLIDQLVKGIMQAWEARAPASVAWGVGQAVIAHNRRTVWADGSSKLYGNPNNPDFRGFEGTEDHGVELLYFWNSQNELIATCINVACPAQEVESRSAVNADFWHQVRETLKEKYGDQLNVLAWAGAAGDQSPHLMYRKAAETRIRKLRGIDSLQDLANRIVAAWEDIYQLVKQDRHDDVVFSHQVETILLPYRKVTAAEANVAQLAYEKIQDKPHYWAHDWHLNVVKRYERQQQPEPYNYEMELHAVRLGDIAIVTNDFELFTDYGMQMKARSPALQTFVIQLCGNGTYLPTVRASLGGGYSAIPQSTPIGPEGGQVLVNESVDLINQLWGKSGNE